MVKLIVLKYSEWILDRLGIYAKHSPNQPDQNVFFKKLSSYYILLTTTAFVVSSAIFVVENSSQFDVALRTCAIAIGTAQSIGMYFSFGTNLKNVHALHYKLQTVIDGSTKGKMFLVYFNMFTMRITS